jgi:hypothetical protein
MRDDATSCCSSAALAFCAFSAAAGTATPAAAPTKVFNNPRLLLTLKRASPFSSLLTLAEAFAMMGKESLICDDDREGKRRVRLFNSLPNDVGFRRVAIPDAIAMVYTHLYRYSKPFQNSSLVAPPRRVLEAIPS